jgi:4-hydroxy-tetrahydrodipicolinate reductase
MRIALIGYGKMGRMVEEIALLRQHEIIIRISSDNQHKFTAENLKEADTAIEFTSPEAAFQNIKKCIDFGVPVISGTTGWNTMLPELKQYCLQVNGTFLHASNFSVGVNIFFEINKLLAKLMDQQSAYDVSIREIHHSQKKDAPSGTAVTLAEQILSILKRKNSWINYTPNSDEQLEIISERKDPAAGTHYVKYSFEVDDIEIVHTAHSRKGFALGAILAAEFICNKKGVFSMEDVLNF